MARLEIDVFGSWRSPWSCLASPHLPTREDGYDAELRFRPVDPVAIRTPEFLQNEPPFWLPCFQRGVAEVRPAGWRAINRG